VVVARGAAGGEGVAEPEAVLGGDAVGDVREGRGPLVGGHDEVRIVVVVVAHHLRGWDHAIAGEVVGQVEHTADKGAVAGDDLLHQRVAAAARRWLLDHEAALRADRYDNSVLNRLGFHEAQDLGAEVLPAVGPADAASRDLPASQVYPLGSRRVDEDLEHRAR
jgi:hypothetical protein